MFGNKSTRERCSSGGHANTRRFCLLAHGWDADDDTMKRVRETGCSKRNPSPQREFPSRQIKDAIGCFETHDVIIEIAQSRCGGSGWIAVERCGGVMMQGERNVVIVARGEKRKALPLGLPTRTCLLSETDPVDFTGHDGASLWYKLIAKRWAWWRKVSLSYVR